MLIWQNRGLLKALSFAHFSILLAHDLTAVVLPVPGPPQTYKKPGLGNGSPSLVVPVSIDLRMKSFMPSSIKEIPDLDPALASSLLLKPGWSTIWQTPSLSSTRSCLSGSATISSSRLLWELTLMLSLIFDLGSLTSFFGGEDVVSDGECSFEVLPS